MTAAGFFGNCLERELRARRNRDQHLLLAVNQGGGVVAGDLESVSMGNGVGGARLHAIAAKDATVVIDVVNLGITLAAADTELIGIFGRFNIDAIGGTRGGAQETRDAFFQPVFVSL